MSTPSEVFEAMRAANQAAALAADDEADARRERSKRGYEGDYVRARNAETAARALRHRFRAVQLFAAWLAGFEDGD